MLITQLPPEVLIQIASSLNLSQYRNLSITCRSINNTLCDPYARSQLLLRYFQCKSDALLFAFNKQLVQEAEIVINTCVYPIRDLSDPFAQIVCSETRDNLFQQQSKALIIKLILEKSRASCCKNNNNSNNNNCNIMHEPINSDHFSLSLQDMAVMALRWCSYFGEYLVVGYLLKDFGLRISSINCYMTWWIRMLRSENFDLITLLLENGAEIIGTLPDNTDEPPIMSRLPPQVVDSKRASLSVVSNAAPNLYPLRVMATEGRLSAVRLLLQKTPEYKRNPVELQKALYMALISASMENRVEVLNLISEEFECALNVIDEEFDCPRMACALGHVEFFTEYMRRVTDGSTNNNAVVCQKLHLCLIQAVESNKSNMIPLLVEFGCNVSLNNEEALIAACKMGYNNVILRLLECGASVEAGDCMPVKVAARNGNFNTVNMLIAYCEKSVGTSRSLKWKMMAKCKEIWRGAPSA